MLLDDRSGEIAMLALQGPEALDLVPLPELEPFGFTDAEVCGVRAIVARTGYTGEPGVELMVAAEAVGPLWDALVAAGATPAGLGARDTSGSRSATRSTATTWTSTTPPSRRASAGCARSTAKDFVGADALRAQRAAGDYDRLVAVRVEGRGIPRQGMAVRPAGEVTSGTMSPSLGVGIGMAYVPADLADEGTALEIDARGRPVAARVAAKPLYVKETVS